MIFTKGEIDTLRFGKFFFFSFGFTETKSNFGAKFDNKKMMSSDVLTKHLAQMEFIKVS